MARIYIKNQDCISFKRLQILECCTRIGTQNWSIKPIYIVNTLAFLQILDRGRGKC